MFGNNLSYLVNSNAGNLLSILALLAIVTTLSNFSRYIFGLKTLGLYASLILAIAYYLTGARVGIILTLIIVAITFGIHNILKRVRMHYLSRIAINYIAISGIFFILYYLIGIINYTTLNTLASAINPVSIVLIASLSDFVLKLYVKKDFTTTIRSFGETMMIAIFGWAIITYPPLQHFIVKYIWIVLLLIPMNIIIGQTTIMRLTEFLRFKKIIEDAPRNS